MTRWSTWTGKETLMQRQPYRHGDVLLVPVDETPGHLRPIDREDGLVVLAHGESTGHRHTITHDDAVLSMIMGHPLGGDRFLQLARPATLRQTSTNPAEVEGRELHGPIELPAGGYIVRIQRQLDRGKLSQVID